MKIINVIILVLSILIISGCGSGKFNSTPLNPQDEMLKGETRVNFDESMISSAMLGSYELMLDLDSMTAELVNLRIGAIGESYIVNGLSYFTISPCSDCFKIKSIALTNDGYIDLGFVVRHPFQAGDPLKPPSALNRLDLDIFDTALLIKPLDTVSGTYSLTGDSVYSGFTQNSDGFTRELSAVLSDDAALPYVLVVDDNEAGTDTFNEFSMGDEAEFNVIFSSNGTLNFNLFLTMGYGASARKSSRLNPTYYNPEFNRKSAWKVNVIPPNGDDPPQMGNTWNNVDLTTPFDVTVEAFDWQIGATVNPELLDPTEIYAASDVGSVSVEIPGMNNSLITETTASSGTGTTSDPLIYTLGMPNENLLPAGEYTGLVKVTDERVPGVVIFGGETDTLADSPDGISLNWAEIPEFATYQTFTATVVYGCGPITGSITTPVCPISGINSGQSVDFSAVASSDNGGDPVVLYEWDMDYDGIPSNFILMPPVLM